MVDFVSPDLDQGVLTVRAELVEHPRLTARNSFAMPAIITPEQAAEAVLRGMRRRGFEIHFPRRFTWVMKLMRALPCALSLPLLRRLG